MKCVLETITPKKAMEMLSYNTTNRTVNQHRVDQMVADLKSGAFTICTAPIAFYADESLADGQHRLWAVVESEMAHDFFVLRDLPKEAGLNIDTHRPRTLVDNARITGQGGPGLTNNIVSTCRVIVTGERTVKNTLSFAQRLELTEAHMDAARWALTNGPQKATGKYLKNSLVWGAMARAFYIERELPRLAQFGSILGSGFYNTPEDTAAITLRNFIINNPVSHLTTEWSSTFLKAQNAIWYFMRRKPLTAIKAVGTERYPLRKK